jgi:Tfp pilus assembly protein PilF
MPERDNISRMFQQAFASHRAGRLAQAAAGYRQVLALDPRHADSLNFLGVAAAQSGRPAEAVELIGRAIRQRGTVADYHDNLGLALQALGRLDEAGNSHRKALRLDPKHASAHNHFGNVLAKRGQPDEAERHYRATLAINPHHVEALNNLAVTLTAQERPEAALPLLQQALQLHPGYVDAYANLGAALRNLARIAEAEAAFRDGLRRSPDTAPLQYNLASLLLLTGRFAEGWPLYEARLRVPGAPPPRFTAPQWQGEKLGDRTLLVHAEQGAGDTILACRYLPLLAANARVVFEVPAALRRAVKSCAGTAELVARGEKLPEFDLHCPLMSLPLACGTAPDSIPGESPYLAAEPDLVAAWRQRLAALPGLRVGLVWAGNPDYADDRRRSIPSALLAPLAATQGISFVSLQKPAMAAPLPLADWTEELGDFAETAGLIQALDLVIGVDTAVIHLAGALGRPTWLLNRYDPHFLWLLDREDSPWYPTLRQFRQPAPGDWPSAIAALKAGLSDLASYKPRQN